MKKYQGIIFDLDGTLLDTIEDLSDSLNYALSSFGYPGHSCSTYKKMIGEGVHNLIECSLPKGNYDSTVFANVLKLFLKTYKENYMKKTKPYDGICEMLSSLSKMGIKIGVNSNKRADYTNSLVEKYFADIPFIEVFGEREGIPKKPDPVAALEIAGLMELPPERVLYVGDSKTDIQTGFNAGMDTVGVLWGFRDFEELTTEGAAYIIEKPNEILTKIL